MHYQPFVNFTVKATRAPSVQVVIFAACNISSSSYVASSYYIATCILAYTYVDTCS